MLWNSLHSDFRDNTANMLTVFLDYENNQAHSDSLMWFLVLSIARRMLVKLLNSALNFMEKTFLLIRGRSFLVFKILFYSLSAVTQACAVPHITGQCTLLMKLAWVFGKQNSIHNDIVSHYVLLLTFNHVKVM